MEVLSVVAVGKPESFFFICQKVQQQLILTCYGLSMYTFVFQNTVDDKIKHKPIYFL